MKYLHYTILISLVVGLIACKRKSSDSQIIEFDEKNRTTVKWIDSVQNFGRIKEGEKVEISFRFKNTGVSALIITDVRPGCGCTVADKPERPIASGGEGVVRAVFNSDGRSGFIHKTIFVYGNLLNNAYTELVFEGEVVKKCD